MKNEDMSTSKVERKMLDECSSDFRLLLYTRYVDDTFTVFCDASHVTCFLNYVNTRHANLSFAHEQEFNKKLSFLDVNAERDLVFRTSIYRRPTFTGLFSIFQSFSPLIYNIGLVKSCLVVNTKYVIALRD